MKASTTSTSFPMSEQEFIHRFVCADELTQRIIKKLVYGIDLDPQEQAYVDMVNQTMIDR